MLGSFLCDFVKYVPSKLGPALISLIAVPIVSRLFDPSSYGYYSLIMSAITILSILSGWILMSVIRYYPTQEVQGNKDAFVGLTCLLLVLFIVILDVTLMSTIVFMDLASQLKELIWPGLILFNVIACCQVLETFLRVKGRVSLYSGFVLWRSISRFGLGIASVLLLGNSVSYFLLGHIFGLLVALPYLAYLAFGDSGIKLPSDFSIVRKMVCYSIPLVIGNLSAWILNVSDRYLLISFRNSYEVGIYSINYDLASMVVLFFVSLVKMASDPVAIRLYEKRGEHAAKAFIGCITRFYLIIGVPSTVGISIIAQPIAAIILGPEYQEGATIFGYIAMGFFLLGLQHRCNLGLRISGNTRVIMLYTILAAIVNIVLNLMLVPSYGYVGASISTVVSYFICFLFSFAACKKHFAWNFPWKTALNASSASVLMGVSIFALKRLMSGGLPHVSVALGVLVGVVTYGIAMLLLGELKLEDYRKLYNLSTRFLGIRV